MWYLIMLSRGRWEVKTGKMTGGMLPLYIEEWWQNVAPTLSVCVVYIVACFLFARCFPFCVCVYIRNGQHTYMLQYWDAVHGKVVWVYWGESTFVFFHFYRASLKKAICPLIGERIGISWEVITLDRRGMEHIWLARVVLFVCSLSKPQIDPWVNSKHIFYIYIWLSGNVF